MRSGFSSGDSEWQRVESVFKEMLSSRGEEESAVKRYERRRVPKGRIESGCFRCFEGTADVGRDARLPCVVAAMALRLLPS